MTQQRQRRHLNKRREPTRPTRSSMMTSKSSTVKEITSSMSTRRRDCGTLRMAMARKSAITLWSLSSPMTKVRMSSRSSMATKSSITRSSTYKKEPTFVPSVARQRSSLSFRRYLPSIDFSSPMQSSATATMTSSFSASSATIKPYATKTISKCCLLKAQA